MSGTRDERLSGESRTIREACRFTQYSVYADEGRVLPPFIEIVRRYGILVRPPGERFEYSNLGYGLLEQAISHIAKRDFEVFMREEVFEPLGLSRMALGPNPRMTRETAARYAEGMVPSCPSTKWTLAAPSSPARHHSESAAVRQGTELGTRCRAFFRCASCEGASRGRSVLPESETDSMPSAPVTARSRC